jgi:methionine-S-sulfoxide reductase
VRAALLAAGALVLAAVDTAEAAEPKVATFASGCFWCTEADFEKVPGVVEAVSGYTGGHDPDPSYREVSAGGTGHTEAVRVRYDPDEVGYERLLEVYWRNVDPLDAGGQFCDRGDQYRPAIFAGDEEQRRLAEESKAALERSGRFGPRPIVVEVVSLPRQHGRGHKVGHAALAICVQAWAGVKKPRPEWRRRRL